MMISRNRITTKPTVKMTAILVAVVLGSIFAQAQVSLSGEAGDGSRRKGVRLPSQRRGREKVRVVAVRPRVAAR